jgi:cation diffusion facilitator CzcD-associated flavoprotein CzcO
MTGPSNVAIIGAGPYGLSIAAHLRPRGIEFRIFGSPMQSWRTRMPADMFLKSEGFASSLYDPAGRFTLQRFCAEQGLRYAAIDVPVPLETFTHTGSPFSGSVFQTWRIARSLRWTGRPMVFSSTWITTREWSRVKSSSRFAYHTFLMCQRASLICRQASSHTLPLITISAGFREATLQ